MALGGVRDTARTVQSELKPQQGWMPGVEIARAAVDEVFENACRILEERELDVVWLSRDPRRGPVLRVAPMSVAMLVRDKVFRERTVVLTSAAARTQRVLRCRGRDDLAARRGCTRWRGLGSRAVRSTTPSRASRTSPSACRRRGDGLAETLDEIEALVRAAGGHARAVLLDARRQATEAMRERFADKEGEIAFLCQGRGPDQHAGAAVRP